MALLAAYPELSTKKEITQVSVGHKFAEWFDDGSFKIYTENMLNPANEKVYQTLDKIYSEIAKLFPGEYIHMGGDECYKGYWEESNEVKNFMKKNEMENMHDLQAYFIDRVQKIIESKGKKMIGWDEITEGHLNQDAAVMSWQGTKGGIKAAKLGHKVVMSPTTYAYLDYIQGDKSVENSIYASLSLEKSYKFEPVPDSVNPKFIMGGQGNLWTEVIPTLSFAYYMTYPRALSISETLWSPKEKKNWENFANKTLVHFNRFDEQKIKDAIYYLIDRFKSENTKGNDLYRKDLMSSYELLTARVHLCIKLATMINTSSFLLRNTILLADYPSKGFSLIDLGLR